MKNKWAATAVKLNTPLPALPWSPQFHLTEKRLVRDRGREVSFFLSHLFHTTLPVTGKAVGLATPNRGGQNWSARITLLSLSAAEGFPITAPAVLHGLKVLNLSSFVWTKTSLPFVFKSGTQWALFKAWTTKTRQDLSCFQENETIGRLGTR